MPLQWDIRNTELGKIRDKNPEDSRNCEDILISLIGMKVLNIKGYGYTPTLEFFELDENTIKKIESEAKKEGGHGTKFFKTLPLMVGARFKRSAF